MGLFEGNNTLERFKGLLDGKNVSKNRQNQTRNTFRLLACVLLGYYAITLLRVPAEEADMPTVLRIGIPLIFLAFALVIGISTLRRYIHTSREIKREDVEMAAKLTEEDIQSTQEENDADDNSADIELAACEDYTQEQEQDEKAIIENDRAGQ